MEVSMTEHSSGGACLGCTDVDKETRRSPRGGSSIGGAPIRKFSRSISFMKIGLVASLLVWLIILSSVDMTESRRLSRKNKTPGENDITVDETGGRGSRRRNRKNRILKTSEQARIITEKRYLRSDWCKIHPLKQVVRTRNGCEGTFINNFCYGQCNSFYIPRELGGDDREQEAFKSCSFCKPYKTERVSVTLKCPGKRSKRGKKIKRMVNKIKECRCIAVPDIDSRTPAPETPVAATSSSSATTEGESRR